LVKGDAYPGIALDYDQERLYEITLPQTKGSHGKFGEIMFAGDFHYGHECFSRSHLLKYINLVKNRKHLMVGLMGDIIELTSLSPFLAREKIPVNKQLSTFLTDFIPIKDRILWTLWGNHELRFASKAKEAIDMMDYVKVKLGNTNIIAGEPNRGIWVVVRSGKQRYPIYVAHSKTRAVVNEDLQLKRSGSQFLVPLIAHGHTHRMGWKRRTFISVVGIDDSFYRGVYAQYLMSTGCFLRYPGYAEARSMPFSDIGAPIVRFYSSQNEIEYIDSRVRYKDFIHKCEVAPESLTGEIDCSDIKQVVPTRPQCPNCKETNKIMKAGFKISRRGKEQRYQCRSCGFKYVPVD